MHVADPPLDPDDGLDHGSTTGTPRWVKVSGIIAIVLILLFAILHLAGGGLRGHTPEGHTPPAGSTEHGAQQP